MSDLLPNIDIALRGAFMAMPYLFAVLLGLLIPVLVLLFIRRPDVGLVLVSFVFFMDIFFTLPVFRMGVTLFLPDVMAIILLGIGFYRFLSGGFNRIEVCWLLFSLVFLSSVALGIAQNGSSAGVEARYHLHYWAVVTYFMRAPFSIELWQRSAKVYGALGIGIVLVCVYRWLGMAMGFGDALEWNEAGQSLRVLTVDPAGALVMGVFLAIYAKRLLEKNSLLSMLAVPFFLCVVVLQHRTVWVAGLVTVLFMFVTGKKGSSGGAGAWASILGAVVVAGVLMMAGGGGGNRLTESLGRSVQEASAQNSTWAWRTESWAALLKKWVGQGPKSVAIGESYGSGFERRLEGSQEKLQQNPHSNYVYLLLRVGIIGTISFLVPFFLSIAILVKRRSDPYAIFLGAGLVFQLAYFVTYPGSYGMAFFVGIAWAYVAHLKPVAPSQVSGDRPSRHLVYSAWRPKLWS